MLEFWSCLDPKQRDSLLTIKGRSVMETMDCELCLELLASATRLIDEGKDVVLFVFFPLSKMFEVLDCRR